MNYNFILSNRLTWIDNLITGSGKNLASPLHPNHTMPYVRDYLRTVGERKCEANTVVVVPRMGEQLCEQAILKYLGDDADERFKEKRRLIRQDILAVMDKVKVKSAIERAMRKL